MSNKLLSGYLVIDCDNFFASCEAVFRPDFAGKPLVVLSSNDACVIARSKAAKDLGIAMGAPYFKVKDTLWAHKVICLSAHFNLYRYFSNRVTKTLKQFFSERAIEQYSIDEWFIKVSGSESQINALAKELQKTIFLWLSLPVSIGFGSTKTLAKVAVWQAKAKEKPVILNAKGQTDDVLATMPVKQVWGIGWRQEPKLLSKGITHAIHLTKLSDRYINSNYNVVFRRTVKELKGLDCVSKNENPHTHKSLMFGRTFSNALSDLHEIENFIAVSTTKLTKKLRTNDLCAGGLLLYIRAKGDTIKPTEISAKGPKQRIYVKVFFEEPTNDPTLISKLAIREISTKFKNGLKVDKLRLVLLDIKETSVLSLPLSSELFSSPEYQKSKTNEKLWEYFDRHQTPVKIGSALLGGGRWQPKAQWLSSVNPYSLSGLPLVK